MRFEEWSLDPKLLGAIAGRGYVEATDVQARTLEVSLRNRDVAVQSQTGTGKTAAFLITVFDRLLKDPSRASGRTLIIVPTRELAAQIAGEARLLNKTLGFSIGCFYGGIATEPQLAQLRKGVDIIIGTPGRLLDLAERGALRLRDIRILVIDEADRLFDMGFLPDINRIVGQIPPAGSRQGMLFSATLDRLAREVANRYLDRPAFIDLTPKRVTLDAILQELYRVPSQAKADLLMGILKAEAPRNAIIFTNTRHGAERLARRLDRSGLSGRHLTGDLSQQQRTRVMDDFTAGRFSFLVATDLAARGLDIEGLALVVNYDLPLDTENYVHRIGRTGRAGQSGKAVSLACEKYSDKLTDIERYIGMKIPVKSATSELIAEGMSLEFSAPARPANPRVGGYDRNGGRREHTGHRAPRRRSATFSA